jgi:hypothetical protein
MCRTEKYWAFEIAQVEEEEVGLHTVTEGSPAVEEDVFVVSEDSAVLSMVALLAVEPVEKACCLCLVDDRALTEQVAVLEKHSVGCMPDAEYVAVPVGSAAAAMLAPIAVVEDAVFVIAVLQTESQMNSHVAALVELVSKFWRAVKK